MRLAGADIELPPPANETAPAAGTEVAVGVRPEKIEIRAAADFGDRFEGGAVFCGEGKIHARATIDAVDYRGRLTEYGLACENELRLVVSTQNTSPRGGGLENRRRHRRGLARRRDDRFGGGRSKID